MTAELLTVGDLTRRPEFGRYSRPQIEYALRGIPPIQRVGIIRTYNESQIPTILEVLDHTTRRSW